MEHYVFDDYDCVVDDEADCRGQAAQCHEIEALSNQPEKENRDSDGDRNHHAGDKRGPPIVQKEEEDDTGEDKAYENSVAHAGDAVAD